MSGLIKKVKQQFHMDMKPTARDGGENNEEDPRLFKKTQVALWVLDSNNTHVTKEEILQQTGIHTLADAYGVIKARLKEEGTLSVFLDIELPLICIIDRMQQRGICVSRETLRWYNKKLMKEKETLIKNMREYADPLFNPNSPQQVAETLQSLGVRLHKKTAHGHLSTGVEQLQSVKDQHNIIPMLLRYRHISKLQTGYTQSLPRHIDENGRVHTSFFTARHNHWAHGIPRSESTEYTEL